MTDEIGSRATPIETVRVAAQVLAPLVARGLVLRRPRVVALSARWDLDRRAVRLLQRLRARHGDGPLQLRIPGRSVALVLAPRDVVRILRDSPEPFAPATKEKRAALGHFQPHGLLASPAERRPERRRFNEAVLDAPQAVHRLAPRFVSVVRNEATGLLKRGTTVGHLDAADLRRTWWRIIRRIVLGDGAADDHEVTDLLEALRGDANWGYLHRRRHRVRGRFERLLDDHLARAEPGSLAALASSTPAGPGTEPHQQVPQWLFAFDAASLALLRALAILDSHPAVAALRTESRDIADTAAPLPFTRACLLESLRLWPTTPALLRDTTTVTEWTNGALEIGTALVIYVPFFHRDDAHGPAANRFEPHLWLDGAAADRWPLVPFSGGPATCPGQNLTLLVTSTMLATLLQHHELSVRPPSPVCVDGPLPGTLNPFALAFDVRRWPR